MIAKHLKKCRNRHLALRTKLVSMIVLGLLMFGTNGYSQTKPKFSSHSQSHSEMVNAINIDDVPYGYVRVGTTDLCYKNLAHSIDFRFYFDGYWRSTTTGNSGYQVAIRVTLDSKDEADAEVNTLTEECSNGYTYNGVLFSSYVEQQGELAKVCYSLTNTNDCNVTISLGTYCRNQLINSSMVRIARRKDQFGNTYGLTLKGQNSSQMCILFGECLPGVTKVDDFWFGDRSNNRGVDAMVGDYTPGNRYMIENDMTNTAMGWCWKNRTITAGETIVFSYLVGVGDVSLEPNSTFEVTPEDPDGWNDLSRPHKLTLTGEYESPTGIEGMIEYSVEDSEEWKALTQMMVSGEKYTKDLIAIFDPSKEIHTILFRTVDALGNTSVLTPIVYKDVSYHEVTGIVDKVYNYGDSIYQTNLICDLVDEQYVVNDYRNNTNVGTASFKIQGVFPETIGSRKYTFQITPRELEGELVLSENNLVYNGAPIYPTYHFTYERPETLLHGIDYGVSYNNNLYPGVGTLEVFGKGNYKGTLMVTFTIDKAQLSAAQYELALPNNDISYDGEAHSATLKKEEGVGEAEISYVNTEDNTISYEAPSNVGSYDIYIEFAEGPYYYGKENEKVGSFSIYNFDDAEWLALKTLKPQLVENGWTPSWDLEAGPVAVSKFEGLVIEQGHVVGMNFPERNLTAVPTEVADFPQLKSLDLSHNSLTGNASEVALQIPSLTSLNLSYNKFSDLSPMLSPNITSLDISHQSIDVKVPINFSELSIEDVPATIPSIVLYDHENQAYNQNINLLLTTGRTSEVGDEDWAIGVDVNEGGTILNSVSENNAYYGASGDELMAFDSESGSSFKIALNFNQGDVNFIGGMDAADLQATILYAFGGYRNYPFNFTAADTYCDGLINLQDIICLVNILLSQETSESPSMLKAPGYSSSQLEVAQATIYVEDGKIILCTDKPAAAISVRGTRNIDWCLDRFGLIQTVQGANVVAYSLSGATIPSGQTVIGSYLEEAMIGQISLCDEQAQNISVTICDNQTTGIENNLNDLIDNDTEIYDITGRRINSIGSGVNIIRKGNKTIKVVGGLNQ